MKKILFYGLLAVILLSSCKGAPAPTTTVDTVYVKDVITYKVKITYINGDVDTVYVKQLRSDNTLPHIDGNHSYPYFDMNPDDNQSNDILYYVRRADILSKN